jgi:hypothetical protein
MGANVRHYTLHVKGFFWFRLWISAFRGSKGRKSRARLRRKGEDEEEEKSEEEEKPRRKTKKQEEKDDERANVRSFCGGASRDPKTLFLNVQHQPQRLA